MKLVFAIVHNEDGKRVVDQLNKNGFSVTKLCSTGGFLKSGNTTLLVGVEPDKIDDVIAIVKKNSKSRKEVLNMPIQFNSMEGLYTLYPTEIAVNGKEDATACNCDDSLTAYSSEVVVGGAIIFVLDVERFEKV